MGAPGVSRSQIFVVKDNFLDEGLQWIYVTLLYSGGEEGQGEKG